MSDDIPHLHRAPSIQFFTRRIRKIHARRLLIIDRKNREEFEALFGASPTRRRPRPRT